MLFPKHNIEITEVKENAISRLKEIYTKINPALFYLYPFYRTRNYKEGLLLIDGTIIIPDRWGDTQPIKQSVVVGKSYKFTVKPEGANDNNLKYYEMEQDEDFKDTFPTKHEFECFCLQNNIDTNKVKLYDELEVNNQLLMFAKSVGIPEDILESWRLQNE